MAQQRPMRGCADSGTTCAMGGIQTGLHSGLRVRLTGWQIVEAAHNRAKLAPRKMQVLRF